MKEIAYTSFGRNSLVTALISHAAALITGMMPASGAGLFFSLLYPFYWLLFIAGVYKELSERGYSPSASLRFYMAAAAAGIPVIGPLTGLMVLYNMQGSKHIKQDEKSFGFIASIFKLRANLLLVFLFVVIIFIVFALVTTKSDPYFKRKAGHIILPNTAFGAEKPEFVIYKSEGKYFSVLIPPDWGKEENFFPKSNKEYGVRLRAPGLSGLEYVLIDIAYYAGRHRTPERFIFDKLNPSWPKGVEHTPVQDVTISGMTSKTFEIKSSRFPIAGIGDAKVDALERYVVFPARKGFFVLLYNAPAGAAEQYRALFDKVLHSFKPLISAQAGPGNRNKITEEEYRVFTAFFSIKETPGTSNSPMPHDFPSKGRLVSEKTSAGKKITGDFFENPDKPSDRLDASLIESYNNRNTKEYLITDKILVPELRILTEEEKEAIKEKYGFGKGFSRGLMESYPLHNGITYLSAIGFSSEKNTALFSVSNSNGLTGVSYYIVMEKTGNGWRLKNAVLNDFWYY